MNRPTYKLPCDHCGSSDAVTDYGTHSHCYSCGKHVIFNDESNEDFPVQSEAPATNLQGIDKGRITDLTHRGISAATAAKYSVWKNYNNDEFVYPFFDVSGKRHVANQFKTVATKGFMVQGDYGKTALFGQQVFPPGCSKQITVVEGADDALAAFQMTGSKYPVVAVKSASSALKEVRDNWEYLNSFETVVLCFDKDEPHKEASGRVHHPGQDAAQKVAAQFELGKVRVLTLAKAKDANDYLKKGWTGDFVKEWWDAPVYSPVGIERAKDCWNDVLEAKNAKYEAVKWPWEGLNKLTYGIRPSELVTITANPKVGKTSILRETVFSVLQQILDQGERRVGVMFLEEPKKDTLLGLMSLTANKPLHLPDILEQTSEQELKKYFDSVYSNDKVILWNHFGSNDIATVLNYIRYMAALGCKHIILDHLSIIVSDQSGDERKQLDEITTKIKTLTMELAISVIVVIHQNRQGQIRGTAGVEQLSNIVIKLYRDMLSDDEEIRNTMQVIVEMNRFSGKTGPACVLRYDGETGRLTELAQEEWSEYLNKDKKLKDRDNEW